MVNKQLKIKFNTSFEFQIRGQAKWV